LEVIQETTFRAYRSVKRLKQPEFFQTWLIRILINVCNDELKHLRTQTPLSGEVNQHRSIVLDDSNPFNTREQSTATHYKKLGYDQLIRISLPDKPYQSPITFRIQDYPHRIIGEYDIRIK
jgi:DNA-directed RNA polymerase specialized sigma24 family protein